MAKVDVKCPRCGGTEVHRNGKCRTGEQRYICNASECSLKTFRLEYRYKGADTDRQRRGLRNSEPRFLY